jgi:hypothetical protein
VKVLFACPICDYPARLRPSGTVPWQCPACDHRLQVEPPPADQSLPACLVCGNSDLYKKKDFPHGLGLAILSVACLVSFISYGLYEKWLTYAILIGTAAFDGLLYLWVGDAVVCYRCHAHYRGLTPSPDHKPFELTLAERYRQERLRREQLQAERQDVERN